jgi:L-ascorbate peroxidase
MGPTIRLTGAPPAPAAATGRAAAPRRLRPRAAAAAAGDDAAPSTSAPAASRRGVLLAAALAAAPLLAPSPLPAHAAAGGPRPLTPAERAALDAAFATTLPRAKAPVALRLVFHDAATHRAGRADGGANASVRLELGRPESFGLNRGWSIVAATAAALAGGPAAGLSRADLVALAGAHAVLITGGPAIEVPVGRLDAEAPDPEGRLPAETLSAPEQLALFAAMGLSRSETVALCGSHTIGAKGFGDPLTFDNTYFKSLLARPWENAKDPMAPMIGLPTDRALAADAACRPAIERYAADQGAFFADFAAAYVKLAGLGARWASEAGLARAR